MDELRGRAYMASTVSAEGYLEALAPIMAAVSAQADGPIQTAADLVVESLRADGVVQAFGSGHSEALAMEIAGRAGGLVPTNRIALRDLVLLGGEPREVLSSGILERDPTVAARLYDLTAPAAADIFVIASNSGVNGSIVELARIVKEKGHKLIALTSLQHTSGVESRHPSGTKLIDHADVVLDNGAPYGDSVLELPGGGSVCAVSSITAALLAQLLVAEVVRRLTEAGETPPVYLSANIPGGDDHNHVLEARYDGRIRRTA
ncbi:sugar isomerase domain-containing protein [Kribbella deserti]|uniref:Sugar isomerase domain-containing protein n=1 Tax=Kribbella deserti TaxID=1926257 RepID=A0ABV6QUL9_9ACTN